MTFHAYFRYVCLFLTCLYMAFSAHMHAQEYRQRSDTTRTLLIIDGENGNPIEGAGVLAGGQVLVSLSEGTVTIPSRNSADTVLVQSLGYKSQYISLKDVFKRKNTYTIRLSPEMTTLGEVIIIGERSGITRNAVSGQIPCNQSCVGDLPGCPARTGQWCKLYQYGDGNSQTRHPGDVWQPDIDHQQWHPPDRAAMGGRSCSGSGHER